jgi:SAM-dependent methyltransferase
VASLPPDYDVDPERSRAFRLGWQEDVHGPVAQHFVDRGVRSVVDVGSGVGRFAAAVHGRMAWIGVDNSPRQLQDCNHRPVIRADAVALPFRSGSVDAVVMLWMLYHLDNPAAGLREARRVLRFGRSLAACAASRRNDPELVPKGYPATSFDAEDALEIVATVFGEANVEVERWDAPMVQLHDREELMAYARSHLIPADTAERVEVPVTLTKRGCLIWARKA